MSNRSDRSAIVRLPPSLAMSGKWKMSSTITTMFPLMKRNWRHRFELAHASLWTNKESSSTTGKIYKLNDCCSRKWSGQTILGSRWRPVRHWLTLTLIILSGFWQQSTIINNGCYAFDIGKSS